MKINSIKNLLLLSSILFASCETVVDVNIELEKPLLVVNSVFNKDSVWRVDVNLTRNVLSDRIGSPVTNATVSIVDEQTNELLEVLTFSPINFGGTYRGKLKPEILKNYKVKVDVEGFTSAESIERIPESVSLTKVEVDEDALQSMEAPVPVKIYFTDPQAIINFYQLTVVEKRYQINYTTGDTIWYSNPVTMVFEDPALMDEEEYTNELLLSDRLFNGKDHSISFKIQPYFSDAQIISICFSSISESYYEYQTTSSLQRDVSGDPFAQPVQVFTNIQNGLGVFAAYNQDEWKIKKNP